ncbi:PEGA domain-containing protein [Corallococcus sp. BB11-1]|uniref:PEGA domain-containing protein n=1 Tax=Corallococcus sp. BB11-1 TaxID=2996783 RepID=UPI00226DE6E5|nr:PEGA domain-containing protein [Corallococcus sp. BB11-1]MCY1036021.1 PEGA domain-containing protein [Corallococcus sp. BB11-1]
MKNQKTWVAVILLGTVAVNTGAYLVVRSRRAAQSPVPSELPVARPVPSTPASPPPAGVVAASDEAKAGLARARRASGLAALEDRDYARAVEEFTAVIDLGQDPLGDMGDLLRIATDLRSREQARAAKAPAQRESPPSKPAPRTRAARLAAARAQAREQQQAAEPEVARGGLLLVTSTPPGLVVLVDGRAVDMTPARLPVSAGSHRVVLAQGDRHLYSETVEVDEDAVRSLNRDLTAELAPAAARPTPPAPAPVVTTATAPAPTARSPEAAPPPEPSVAKAAVAQGPRLGDLEVSSPGLYGEVWINNRPYGFPPVSALALPAGPARLEVRVNGEVKRRMTVEVEPGRSTRVRVR